MNVTEPIFSQDYLDYMEKNIDPGPFRFVRIFVMFKSLVITMVSLHQVCSWMPIIVVFLRISCSTDSSGVSVKYFVWKVVRILIYDKICVKKMLSLPS